MELPLKGIAVILLSCCFAARAAQFAGGGSMVLGQGGLNSWQKNSPAISAVTATPTDTTVVLQWTTSIGSDSRGHCGSEEAVDDGVQSGVTTHEIIVAGLAPSTGYTCTVISGNSTSTVSTTTTATPSSTAITGLTLGSVSLYNSINPNNQGFGDTFYNCKSSDGFTYMVTNDNNGWTESGLPVQPGGGQQQLMKATSESPLALQTIQFFVNYGIFPPPPYLSDGLSSKAFGAFCMAGDIYLAVARQNQAAGLAALPLYSGNIIMSSDHGATWNNPDNIASFTTSPRSNLANSMWPGSPATMGGADFVRYCADDGTLGYLVTCNQHDNGNAYVYLVFNEGSTQGGGSAASVGNVLYVARCPRAKLYRLNGTDWQFYKGSGLDGNLDSSWSSNESDLGTIISNTGKIGAGAIQYIPAKNRYLYLTYYYPNGVVNTNVFNCTWLGYEAPHPWGPWTLIFTQNFSGSTHTGDYNPIILNDTAYTGTTPTVMWTGNFAGPTDYVMRYATLTIN